METDLALLLRADPSTPNQQIRNAAAVLSEKYGIEFSFTAVQAKRWYLVERGVVTETPGSAADIEPPTLPLYNQAFRLPPMRGWLCVGDLHAPYTHWTLLAESISRALDRGVTSAVTMLLDLIGGPRDGLVLWSVYGYCTVDSPTGPWRLTHQRNYSRIRGRVAVQLAAKYGMHVVTYHEHGLGKWPTITRWPTCSWWIRPRRCGRQGT